MINYPPMGTRGNMPGGEYLWIIQAPYYFLEQFGQDAGLARDSAVSLAPTLKPEWFADARLTYPGGKCLAPEAWLRVLALLHIYHIPFKLYQGTGAEDAITSLTLLQPAIDQELAAILGVAAREKVMELQRYQQMLNRAFALLEKLIL